MESLVQVCLPRSIGQKGMIYLVPANCDQITIASICEWNDILSTCQI
jgi:hypothetical protein